MMNSIPECEVEDTEELTKLLQYLITDFKNVKATLIFNAEFVKRDQNNDVEVIHEFDQYCSLYFYCFIFLRICMRCSYTLRQRI